MHQNSISNEPADHYKGNLAATNESTQTKFKFNFKRSLNSNEKFVRITLFLKRH